MKPKRIVNCSRYFVGLCLNYGCIIEDCKPEECPIGDSLYKLIYPDPDFEPFIDELNRRLDKGV